MLLNYKASGSLKHRQIELAKYTDIPYVAEKAKGKQKKSLRLPGLLNGIVVVEVVESDGISRMPV